jgi:3,4-dihydroxy-2-butanone 4-phosphate synthase
MFASYSQIIDSLNDGKIVIVSDSESREDEGDLILPAKYANDENIGFFIRYTSGILCAAITQSRADVLELPQMVIDNEEKHTTAFTVSVDAKFGIGTGISAQDRATTFQLLANENAQAFDFVRPGHIFPLVAADDLLEQRQGHTEVTVHLMKEFEDEPVGVLSEIVDDFGNPLKGEDLKAFATNFDIPITTIERIIEHG